VSLSRTTPVPKSLRAVKLLALFVVAAVVGLLPACTDLSESPASSIAPENFFKNADEVQGGLASVYSVLRFVHQGGGFGDPGYVALSEISTDEMVIPTRGGDWADQGRWIELHTQAWTANSPAGISFINDSWVTPYRGITRANVVLAALDNVAVPNEAVIAAELRTLRALFYYELMDLFGGVPIVTTTEIKPRARNTRKEVFDFIDKELNETRLVLPDKWDDALNGRMTKGAANAILASMYLNAGVFAAASPSATAYNSCMSVQVGGVTACQAAINAADRILNSPEYVLGSDWKAQFRYDNDLNKENILVAKFIADIDLGFHIIQTSLHYNQFSTSPWNGYSIVADAFNQFDPNDLRRTVFLRGPQNQIETGAPVTETAPSTVRLSFTDTIGNIKDARQNEGIRHLKWPHDPNHKQEGNGNDWAYFRLSEMYLIKAEALNEITPGSAQALALINQLRQRVFTTPNPLLAVNRDAILRERLFEFIVEGKRRQDLIRHGKFTAPWQFKTATALPRVVLFSIPQTQLDANPLLVQNPGY
jgi:starch-binding outer membrane protein, SusD/RagB family